MRNLLPLSYGSTEEAAVAVVIIDTASSGGREVGDEEQGRKGGGGHIRLWKTRHGAITLALIQSVGSLVQMLPANFAEFESSVQQTTVDDAPLDNCPQCGGLCVDV